MSKPAHGDPSHDEKVKAILGDARDITKKDIRNLDFDTLSRGAEIFGVLAAQFQRQKDIVFTKKIGGHKGGSH